MSLRPKDVSDHLGISPATLRLWSTKFESYLSPGAQRSTTENGGISQRRYDEADLQYFNRAKQLLAEGLTYDEVFSKLDQGVRVVALDNVPMPQAPTTSPISDVVVVSEVAEQYQKTIAALENTVRSQQETIYYQGQVIERLRDDRRAYRPL